MSASHCSHSSSGSGLISDSSSLSLSLSLSSVSSVNETADGSDEEIMEMDDSKVTTHGSGEEIMEMDASKVDEIEVKVNHLKFIQFEFKFKSIHS